MNSCLIYLAAALSAPTLILVAIIVTKTRKSNYVEMTKRSGKFNPYQGELDACLDREMGICSCNLRCIYERMDRGDYLGWKDGGYIGSDEGAVARALLGDTK